MISTNFRQQEETEMFSGRELKVCKSSRNWSDPFFQPIVQVSLKYSDSKLTTHLNNVRKFNFVKGQCRNEDSQWLMDVVTVYDVHSCVYLVGK